MTHTRTWNVAYEGVPAAGTDARGGYTVFQNFKTDIRQRIALDHKMDPSAPDNELDGFHNQVSLLALAGDPANTAGRAHVYSKTTAGLTSVYAKNSDGTIIPIVSLSAAQILALLLTVDGNGSNLDADFLDGLSSAQFLRKDISDTQAGNLIVTGTMTANVANATSVQQGGAPLYYGSVVLARGRIASDGSIDYGTNFTVNHPSTGVYEITLAGGLPVGSGILATPAEQNAICYAAITGDTTATVTVRGVSGVGNLANASFNLVYFS